MRCHPVERVAHALTLCPVGFGIDEYQGHSPCSHRLEVSQVADSILGFAATVFDQHEHTELDVRVGDAPGVGAVDDDVLNKARVVPGEGLAVFVEPCLFGGSQVQDGVGLSGCGFN